MTKTLKFLAALLLALPLFAQAQKAYTQPELDQMLAPIALYPDPLLSQVLMAATYPLEVVEAARWSRANPGLQGDAAVRAVENQDWDPSVKSLVAFPPVLQRMDEKLEWTQSLGEAFLAQEPQVMDSVQQLRRRAQAAGNLQSNEQVQVQQQGPTIVVQPASPQYVYVPYYDPYVVYGPWWWPAYQPVYWAPWPRSYGVRISIGFFFGNFDWRYRQVRVVHPNAYYYRAPVSVNRAPVSVNRTPVAERGGWQHDPHHRRGVDYRAAEVRQRFAATQVERRGTQRDERRNDRPAARVQAQPAALPQAPAAVQQREQRQERRVEPQVREAQRQAQRQARQQQVQRPSMPAAQSPQMPRAERQERREDRREQRQERGQKS